MGLVQTGERQIAEQLSGIKANHIQRYRFAIERIREHFDYERDLTILDSACGNGYGSHMLGLEGYNVIGVDVCPEAIECARRAYGMQNVQYEVVDLDDEEAWPFYDNRFDAIVSIETIEHVRHDYSLISRFSSMTDFMIGTVPNQDVIPFSPEVHPFHLRHYTKEEFKNLLFSAGEFVVPDDGWYTQYDKIPGLVHQNDDGMGFIVAATRNPDKKGGRL